MEPRRESGDNPPRDNSQQQQQRSGQGNNPGGGQGGNQPKRPVRKSLLDQTNFIYACIWLISALINSTAFASLIIKIPANCRDTSGFLVKDCVSTVMTSDQLPILIAVSIIFQFIFTVAANRITHPIWRARFLHAEWAINVVGFYWVYCVQFGWMPGLKNTVDLSVTAVQSIAVAFKTNFDIPTIVGFLLVMASAIGIDVVGNLFRDAPPTTSVQQQQRKQ